MVVCQGGTSPPLALLKVVYCLLYCTFSTLMTVKNQLSDDTVVVSLHCKEKYQHGPVVDEFVSWCEESLLQLNKSKTKDMVIDFRSNPPCSPPLTHITGS